MNTAKCEDELKDKWKGFSDKEISYISIGMRHFATLNGHFDSSCHAIGLEATKEGKRRGIIYSI